MPEVIPPENTGEWLELALRLAAVAQATNLGLLPWECEPCNTYDDDVPDPACWSRRKPEVVLPEAARAWVIVVRAGSTACAGEI